jgi:hypothetical protein
MYRVVQPWGRDKGRDATVVSKHPTAAEAFAELDRRMWVMARNGAPPRAVELLVADSSGRIVPRGVAVVPPSC